MGSDTCESLGVLGAGLAGDGADVAAPEELLAMFNAHLWVWVSLTLSGVNWEHSMGDQCLSLYAEKPVFFVTDDRLLAVMAERDIVFGQVDVRRLIVVLSRQLVEHEISFFAVTHLKVKPLWGLRSQPCFVPQGDLAELVMAGVIYWPFHHYHYPVFADERSCGHH